MRIPFQILCAVLAAARVAAQPALLDGSLDLPLPVASADPAPDALQPDLPRLARVKFGTYITAREADSQPSKNYFWTLTAGSLVLVENEPQPANDANTFALVRFRTQSGTHLKARLPSLINDKMWYDFEVGPHPVQPPILPAKSRCRSGPEPIQVLDDNCNVVTTLYKGSSVGLYNSDQPYIKCGINGFDIQYLPATGPKYADATGIRIGFIKAESLGGLECTPIRDDDEYPMAAPTLRTNGTSPDKPVLGYYEFETLVSKTLVMV